MVDYVASVMDVRGKLQTVLTAQNKFQPLGTTGGGTGGTGTASTANSSSLSNGENVTLVAGTPVFLNTGTIMKKAVGNSKITASVVGLVIADVPYGAIGAVKTADELVLTTAQWDAITGQVGGLTVNAEYFLNVTLAGKLTKIVPTSGFMIHVGRALSTTKMLINIGNKIQL